MERSYRTDIPLRPVPPVNSHSLLPLPAVAMTTVRDFVAGLARASKNANKQKIIPDPAFGDRTMTKKAIYNIINKVKACGEPAISLHSHHVSLVQWTNPLLPVTRDPGSNPQGGTYVKLGFSC
jgi:hypothetical protein